MVILPDNRTAQRPRFAVLIHKVLFGAIISVVMAMSVVPAAANFQLCNNTTGKVGIAIGYKDGDGWTTEGWWNIAPRSCDTLLRGALVARYYYVYAIDYDRGGEWSGQAFMCTREKEFTVRGTQDCLARGFDRTGFFEVDTGEQRAWTVQLTDAAQQNRPPPEGPPPAPVTPPQGRQEPSVAPKQSSPTPFPKLDLHTPGMSPSKP